jgi:hypothetical protein
MTDYKTTLTLTDPAGNVKKLEGTLSDATTPPDPPDPGPGTCPPPGVDTITLKPGQQKRLLGPGKYDKNGCPTVANVAEGFWPAPTAANRWIKFTQDEMPDQAEPWPLPKMRTNADGSRYYRIMMGSQGPKRLKARWTDPAYDSITKLHKGKTNALSRSLEYVATGNRSLVQGAFDDAMAQAYKLYTDFNQLYTDKACFVLDWCYDALTADQRSQLVQKILDNMAQRRVELDKRWNLHEAHYFGYHSWVFNALAIAGEPGVSADITRQLARAVQHHTGWVNDDAPDGAVIPYAYQSAQWCVLAYAYGLGTDQDMRQRALFLKHRPEHALRLAANGKQTLAFPNDSSCEASGFGQVNFSVQAMEMYWIADYMRDDKAQFVANKIKAKWGTWSRNDNLEPIWSILTSLADDLPGADPGFALSNADANNVVLSRSSWAAPDTTDVSAFLSVGHVGQHDCPRGGHLNVWRGKDELLSSGSNYLGSPSQNKDNWEKRSWSHNCLHFRPSSGATPEKDGSQTLTFPWVKSSELAPNPVRLHYFASDSVIDAPYSLAGRLWDYRDNGDVLIATADLTKCYDPARVTRYWRTLIHVRPGDFLLWDRWACTGTSSVDARFFSRQEPGIGTKAVTINRGGSVALITPLTAAKMSSFGGPGKEQVIDGSHNWLCVDSIEPGSTPHYCQDWVKTHPDHTGRIGRNKGQWVTTFRVDPAVGECLLAIQAGASDATPASPELAASADGYVVTIGGVTVNLPRTGDRQPYV